MLPTTGRRAARNPNHEKLFFTLSSLSAPKNDDDLKSKWLMLNLERARLHCFVPLARIHAIHRKPKQQRRTQRRRIRKDAVPRAVHRAGHGRSAYQLILRKHEVRRRARLVQHRRLPDSRWTSHQRDQIQQSRSKGAAQRHGQGREKRRRAEQELLRLECAEQS